MKSFLQQIIRQKNPSFTFSKSLRTRSIIALAIRKGMQQLRALRLLTYGKNPWKRFFGKGIHISEGNNIRFGSFLQLEDYVYLNALGDKGIRFGNNVRIGAFSRLVVNTSFSDPAGFIHIGDNVGLGEFAYLGGTGGLTIERDCIIGQYLSCHPENHNYQDRDQLIRLQGVSRKGIHIESNCWIGAKVTILDGVRIGTGSIIAAGAVVTKSCPPYSIIGGVPAKLIKKRPNQKEEERSSPTGIPQQATIK